MTKPSRMDSADRGEQFRQLLFKWLFSFMAGITFGDWLRLLRQTGFAVDLPYWPRASLLTLASLSNSLTARSEQRRYGAELSAQQVHPPLFILGHWRTGTTLLHNLLAVDQRFAFPNNFQVCFPHNFLTTEATNARTSFLFPRHRPQDNIRLGMAEAQEDEFALCIATGMSPYLSWVFPERARWYQRYLTFRDVPAEEVACWKAAFLDFAKKLTFKYQRPLVFKSPPHTCRIRLLLEMFPEARFVHIHRNPYTVFQSTAKLFDTATPSMQLQWGSNRGRDERILQTGRAMYDVFFAERALIPRGRWHDVRFEAMEQDPLGELRSAYQALDLPAFEAVEPDVRNYVASLAGYRKNAYSRLRPELRERVALSWSRWFSEWDYAT